MAYGNEIAGDVIKSVGKTIALPLASLAGVFTVVFVAMNNITKNPEKYGFTPEARFGGLEENFEEDVVTVDTPKTLSVSQNALLIAYNSTDISDRPARKPWAEIVRESSSLKQIPGEILKK